MSEFVTHLEIVFREFGIITSKKMFGGYGIYHQGIMFALVADDELYLKADKANEAYFLEKSLPPFEYQKGDKRVKMSYYLAPADIMDDAEQAAIWGLRSYKAAQRNHKPRKKRTSK